MWSAKRFWKNGKIPPPQTNAMKIPLAAGVYLPKPSAARLKIAPHITLVMRPQRNMRIMLTGNSIPLNVTTHASGKNITHNSITIANDDTATNIALLLTLPPTAPPIRRPNIIINQYKPTTVPAIAGPTAGLLDIYRLAVLGIPTSTPT